MEGADLRSQRPLSVLVVIGVIQICAMKSSHGAVFDRVNIAVATLIWQSARTKLTSYNTVDIYFSGHIYDLPNGTLIGPKDRDCVFVFNSDGRDIFQVDFRKLQPKLSELHTGGNDVLRIFGKKIYCNGASQLESQCQDHMDLVANVRRIFLPNKYNALNYLLERCSDIDPSLTLTPEAPIKNSN